MPALTRLINTNMYADASAGSLVSVAAVINVSTPLEFLKGAEKVSFVPLYQHYALAICPLALQISASAIEKRTSVNP